MQKIFGVRRQLLIGIGLAVAAAIGAGVFWYRHRPPPPTRWQGYAEADFVKVGPTQPGLLTEVDVARGDQVAAGTLLFQQDDTPDRAADDQAARQLRQAQEQLANLQAAGKPTEIEQAQANLAEARATIERTKADLDRGEFAPYILIGYVQVLLILVVSGLVFGLPVRGSLGLLLVALGLFIASNLALGLTFSTVATNQMQAQQMAQFALLPAFLMSGFFTPFSGMPLWAQWVGELFPTTHAIRIVRGVLLKATA